MTSLSDLIRTFGRIGILSFGGPAAQIALMEDELVEKQGWLSRDQFLRALSFCMLLPGPEAMQLATYAGWKLRGTLGGLIAGGLFVIPGALVITCLALLYLEFGDLQPVRDEFQGIQALVIVILVVAMRKLAGRALTSPAARLLAVAGFLALFVFNVPYPLLILAAAFIGWRFLQSDSPQEAPSIQGTPWRTSLRHVAIWGGLWAFPIVLAALTGAAFLTDIMAFFSRLAVITFGGAYAVLAYMTQEVVSVQSWITAREMIDALGLAETTPGPLILVTQFVGILAGANEGGPGLGLLAGIATLWVTFIPCFLWIFAFAPHLDRMMALPWLNAALAGVTAAVVGVIANLAVLFALTVLFREVTPVAFGPAGLLWPEGLRITVLILLIIAAGLQATGKLSLAAMVPVMAIFGWLINGLFTLGGP